jgi:hypothetical protein
MPPAPQVPVGESRTVAPPPHDGSYWAVDSAALRSPSPEPPAPPVPVGERCHDPEGCFPCVDREACANERRAALRSPAPEPPAQADSRVIRPEGWRPAEQYPQPSLRATVAEWRYMNEQERAWAAEATENHDGANAHAHNKAARIYRQCAEALEKLLPAVSPAPESREALRAAVEAGWDDGVRFAAEVLRSQVFPRESARKACVDRVLAALHAPSVREEHEVQRLTKERDDWKLATDQFHGMWSDAEARLAVAKRAALAEAAQMARDASEEFGDPLTPHALMEFAAKLAAQAVPPGFCASCTPDIRPQCESASWCMNPQAVPPGDTEE